MPVTNFRTSNRDRVPMSAVSALLKNVSQIGENPNRIVNRSGIAKLIRGTDSGLPIQLSARRFAPLFRECSLMLEAHASQAESRMPHPVKYARMLCHCIITSRNLREAIERSLEFLAMLREIPCVAEVGLTVDAGVAVYHMQTHRITKTISGAVSDLIGLSGLYRLLSWMIGENLPVIAGHLSHGEQFAESLPKDFFPFPLMLGQSCNRLCFPARYLDYPVVCTYSEMLELIDFFPYALPWDNSSRYLLSEQVGSVFRASMVKQDRIPAMEELAEMFGLTLMTFCRRLTDEGTSLTTIKETCRRSLAEGFLDDTSLTLDEIAARLHYSDAGTFRRAFKTWVGVAPADFRRSRSQA